MFTPRKKHLLKLPIVPETWTFRKKSTSTRVCNSDHIKLEIGEVASFYDDQVFAGNYRKVHMYILYIYRYEVHIENKQTILDELTTTPF